MLERWEVKMMIESEELEYAAQVRSLARQLNFVFELGGWGGRGSEFRRNFPNVKEVAFGRNFEVIIGTPA